MDRDIRVRTSDFQPISVNFDWIGQSFEIYKKDWIVWSVGMLPTVVTGVILQVLLYPLVGGTYLTDPKSHLWHPASVSEKEHVVEYVLFTAVASLFNAYILAGINKTAMLAVQGEPIGFRDPFSGAPQALAMLGYCFAVGLASLAGFICFLVGFFTVVVLFLPGYAMVSAGLPVGKALSLSFQSLKSDWLRATGFGVIAIAIYLCASGTYIGLFIVTPMVAIVSAIACSEMVGMKIAPIESNWTMDDSGVLRSTPTFLKSSHSESSADMRPANATSLSHDPPGADGGDLKSAIGTEVHRRNAG